MVAKPPVKVSPIGDEPDSGMPTIREKRTTTFTKGVRNGLIKGTVDQVLDQIATPLAEIITPKLHELHPQLRLADPAVKAAIEFGTLMLLAEILEHGSPLLAKIPGLKMGSAEAQKKCHALALWMRNNAGERVGEQLAETAAALIPLIAEKISDVDFGELFSAVEAEESDEVVEHERHQVFQNVEDD